MKETYYKLNRKRLNESEDYTYLKRKIGYLINRGILEEVQEDEEMTLEEQEEHLYKLGIVSDLFKGESPLMTATEQAIDYAKSKEGLPYSVEIVKHKFPKVSEEVIEELKDEAKKAIDNMFGNPLEQVDSMIEGTKVEEEKYNEECIYRVNHVCMLGMVNDNNTEEPKPFLDGMKPSAYQWKRVSEMLLEEIRLSSSQAKHLAILEIIDLLVEELKKNNVIK